MRAWIAGGFVIGALASACSLVFGLRGNIEPSPGCLPDAGQHTFCELFDESPSWPADAMMLPTQTGTGLVLSGDDAGCFTPPHCLYSVGAQNLVQRVVTTANGAHEIKYDFHTRFDLIDSGVIPRIAWISIDVGKTPATEFGITFAQNASSGVFYAWLFGSPSPDTVQSYASVVPITVGQWLHLTLDVNVDTHSVSLACDTTSDSLLVDYVGKWEVPAFTPADIKSVTIIGGVSTGMDHTAATIDSIVVDITP